MPLMGLSTFLDGNFSQRLTPRHELSSLISSTCRPLAFCPHFIGASSYSLPPTLCCHHVQPELALDHQSTPHSSRLIAELDGRIAAMSSGLHHSTLIPCFFT